jgi:DNA-binding transcriptional ArsR family regulator
MNNKLLDLESRREIYSCIQKHPYLHFREIGRRTKIPFSTLGYHLRYLQKNDLISVKKENGFYRYYVGQSISRQEKKVLDMLRQKLPRKIISYIYLVTVATPKEMSDYFERHISTIQYHLNKLMEIGIIEEAPIHNNLIKINFEDGYYVEHIKDRKEKIYRFIDHDLIRNVFIKYKKSLFHDDFLKICFEISKILDEETGRPRKWKRVYRREDEFIEAIYDIFPHPYHV